MKIRFDADKFYDLLKLGSRENTHEERMVQIHERAQEEGEAWRNQDSSGQGLLFRKVHIAPVYLPHPFELMRGTFARTGDTYSASIDLKRKHYPKEVEVAGFFTRLGEESKGLFVPVNSVGGYFVDPKTKEVAGSYQIGLEIDSVYLGSGGAPLRLFDSREDFASDLINLEKILGMVLAAENPDVQADVSGLTLTSTPQGKQVI